MPDVRVRVYKDDFPDEETIQKMKAGEKFIWVPPPYFRRVYGVGPVLYTMEKNGTLMSHTSMAALALTSRG